MIRIISYVKKDGTGVETELAADGSEKQLAKELIYGVKDFLTSIAEKSPKAAENLRNILTIWLLMGEEDEQ